MRMSYSIQEEESNLLKKKSNREKVSPRTIGFAFRIREDYDVECYPGYIERVNVKGDELVLKVRIPVGHEGFASDLADTLQFLEKKFRTAGLDENLEFVLIPKTMWVASLLRKNPESFVPFVAEALTSFEEILGRKLDEEGREEAKHRSKKTGYIS